MFLRVLKDTNILPQKEEFLQVIDYNAIKRNAQYFRKLIAPSKLCAVLKNNAYGHGLIHVARQIVELVDCFAVGNVDEAEQIQFLNKEVLILLPQCLRATEQAVKADFILTLDSFETLERIEKAAHEVGKTARVHIKIDSGMSRLGFNFQQLDNLSAALQNSAISVEGIFSHFYGASISECDGQLEYFNRCCERLLRGLKGHFIRHIANSGAALLSEKYHLDMVRVGLGLYGYGDEKLLPAKKVCADVIAVRGVPAGSVAGYGAIFKCLTDSKIAVLNVGYANGLPRSLVGAQISINGHTCPFVAICMAMSLVDVTGLEVKVGDTAVLLGDGVNISNDEVIIYELLCNLR